MEPFIGQIMMFAGNFAPRGWAFCDGQLLPIAQNTALFSLIGTTYGGDGKTTFALPDLRGRVPLHQGDGPGLSPYRLGERTGGEQVTLTQSNLPAHSHSFSASNQGADDDVPAGNALAAGQIYQGGTPNTPLNAATVGSTGGSQPFRVVQPLLAINFVIALQGIFPSRG